VHGLLLPLSLLVATLRSADLRKPFLRLVAVRGAILLVLGGFVLASRIAGCKDEEEDKGVTFNFDDDDDKRDGDGDTDSDNANDKEEPVNVDVPGLHLHIDGGAPEIEILGRKMPVTQTHHGHKIVVPPPAPAPTTWLGRTRAAISRGWASLVAFVGVLSVLEGIVVFFSRRWDDWLSFFISGLAGIRPESAAPPVPKIALDLRWLMKKLRRRMRGYIIFASGMPLLYLLRLIPTVGSWLFAASITLWAWYWGGVFTASKSAHAWADDGIAGPPRLVGAFNAGVADGWWFWPLRAYGRLWSRVVRGVNAAATTFDRSPVPFLGLALARGVLALPGLYLLMRPIIPVAAGRLCAEADPADRFSAPTTPPASEAYRAVPAQTPEGGTPDNARNV
jgi:hypothetical protein